MKVCDFTHLGRFTRTRQGDDIKAVVVHRISLEDLAVGPVADAELTGDALIGAFSLHPDLKETTGGLTPYHFLVRRDGIVDQLLRLECVGAHAYKRNKDTIGVAFVGDFTRHTLARAQQAAGVKLLTALVTINAGLKIYRHDETPEGSADEAKRCPGLHFPFAEIQNQIVEALPEGWRTDARVGSGLRTKLGLR